MGWENALSLKDGSFGGWVDQGYPVVEGAASETLVLDTTESDPAVVAAMQEMLHKVPESFGEYNSDDFAAALTENPDL